ncbi:uncharacterized protein LOC111029501 [Myzus persicae]|uniref:uncharacterized protein LOC111029501 n=1 Tax=Myzus persicae TaxID=13164 RepID=UPI000B930EE6|nr:uncharacterized protein LOC111029501 [Myzus persicae]
MSQWKASGTAGRPPYKDYRNRGISTGSISTISSSSSSQEPVELRPSKFYNKDYADIERRENISKIMEQNEQISKKNKEKEVKKGNFLESANTFVKSFSQQASSNSKEEAIRDWEQRQQRKNQEKGLFEKMDQRGYYRGFNQYGGWAKEPKPKEIIRTIYLPARGSEQKGRESRASTDLPPYREKRGRLYPVCPSPDTEDELQKLNNWIEYEKGGAEYSVDKPRALQKRRTSTLRSSSLGMGTLFEGYEDDDSYIDSDEINLAAMCSEYDGDYSTGEEEIDNKIDSDISEAEAACRLTRRFHLTPPIGRRCPKQSISKNQQGERQRNSEAKPVSKTVLRLRGGAKSSSSEMDVTIESATNNPEGGRTSERITNKRNLGHSPTEEGQTTPTNPNKVRKEQSVTPGTPKNDLEKTSFYQRRARELTMYFEKFKSTTKKKLTTTNNSELDKGVALLNDLVTELCLENMHHVGRYTELKRMYDELEESKRRVEFVSPLPVANPRRVRNLEENLTTDTEAETIKKRRKPKKKKKRTTAVTDGEGSTSAGRSQAHITDTDVATSGTERSRPKSLTSSSRKKKEKEMEILEKCRDQAAPVKFIVTTGDKTTEETKKLLWTQVVSKNKAPKIKDSIVLTGGDLMITPADDDTRAAIESLAKEGFGIQKTGAWLPKVIIYDVEKDIRPDELAKAIIEQNPELELELKDSDKIQPKFKRGPKDKDIVHWVCEIRPEIFKKVINRSVYIGYSACKVKEFLDVSICYRCQKYGHIASKCKAIEMVCSYCAELGHKVEDCKNKDKPPKCANCGEAYTSHHKACPMKTSKIRINVRNTDYGQQK